MATPVGNPQNLFLYSAYNLSAGEFFSVTLPLTAGSLIVLVIASAFVLPKDLPQQNLAEESIRYRVARYEGMEKDKCVVDDYVDMVKKASMILAGISI